MSDAPKTTVPLSCGEAWMTEEAKRFAPIIRRINAEREREAAINAIYDEFHNHAGSMAVAIYNLRRAASGE